MANGILVTWIWEGHGSQSNQWFDYRTTGSGASSSQIQVGSESP